MVKELRLERMKNMTGFNNVLKEFSHGSNLLDLQLKNHSSSLTEMETLIFHRKTYMNF